MGSIPDVGSVKVGMTGRLTKSERATRLHVALEQTYARYHRPETLRQDPIEFPRAFIAPADREVVGLIAATLAYGRVPSIRAAIATVLEALGSSPSRALRAEVHRERRFLEGFQYRWTRRADLVGLCEGMRILQADGRLMGEVLADCVQRSRPTPDERGEHREDLTAGLSEWVDQIRGAAATLSPPTRGFRFLLSDPRGAGASKRLHLYLRWMVRPEDGIDLGVWSHLLSPAELMLPLDTHWVRIAKRWGLTRRKTADREMARQITRALRLANPGDPLRYDFSVCHLGISGGCPVRIEPKDCLACPLSSVCASGRRRLRARGLLASEA